MTEALAQAISGPNYFEKRIVHLDLKGAAPKPKYLFELFSLFAKTGFNAILMEYEDMFPYTGEELIKLARKTAYSQTTMEQITENARANGLELIPLVQTFGHMEFVLKHPNFASLREDPAWIDTICPSNMRSIWLIRQMFTQIRSIHTDAESIHIGCDEAWHVGEDELCLQKLNTTLNGSKERLKLEHISRIARIAHDEFGFKQVYAWNDMFDKTRVSLLMKYELGKLLIPVIWGYIPDVTTPGYFPNGLFQRYSQVFDKVLFASAFKGANGITQQFADIGRYMDNLASYRRLYHENITFLQGRLSGIVLTGWQRYAHNKPLCELLPVGIPTLVKQAIYLQDWDKNDPLDHSRFKIILNCSQPTEDTSNIVEQEFVYKNMKFPLSIEMEMSSCKFPGVDLYREIERIRFLLWKLWIIDQKQDFAGNMEDERKSVEDEYQQIRKRMGLLLGKYFYEDTVKEWLVQHSQLKDFKPDDRNLQRFDPILQ